MAIFGRAQLTNQNMQTIRRMRGLEPLAAAGPTFRFTRNLRTGLVNRSPSPSRKRSRSGSRPRSGSRSRSEAEIEVVKNLKETTCKL
jgi:hypothetical protein